MRALEFSPDARRDHWRMKKEDGKARPGNGEKESETEGERVRGRG